MLISENGKNYFALKNEEDKLNKNINEDIKSFEIKTGDVSCTNNLLEQAKEYIKDKKTISISSLQVAFAIGYPKAKKIMEDLIEKDLVGFDEKGVYIVKVPKNN